MALPPLTFPALARKAPSRFRPGRTANAMQYVGSPLTGYAQSVEIPGGKWKFAIGYDSLDEADAAKLYSFLLACSGGRLFTLYMWTRPTPRGAGTGTPTVNGAGQLGLALNVTGIPLNTQNWLLPGDFIGVNGELHTVLNTVNASGNNATITLANPMRYAPPASAVITLVRPLITCRLISRSQEWEPKPGAGGKPRSDFAFDAIEAWDNL